MKQRILFVGHSDTRITPLCAGIMKYLCINKDVKNMEFLSSGFWAVEGKEMHPTLLTSAGEIGIDLSKHRAHYVTMEDVESATFIIPQDEMIARGVASLLGDKKEKLHRPMCVYEPSDSSLGAFRKSREDCMAFCEKLVKKLATTQKEREKISSSIEYRPVKLDEASMVYSLEEMCFSHPWTVANIQAEIEKENAMFMGAFYKKELVGYASCYIIQETAFINNVGVHPQYRQMGIGESLMKSLEDGAKAMKLGAITLEVRSKNAAAIGMYEKLGYKKQGVRRLFYRDPPDDANIMTKTLCENSLFSGIFRF